MGESGSKAVAAAEWRGFWYLPVVAALGYSAAGLQVYAIGPFIEPLQREFDWTRAQVVFGLTIANGIGVLFNVLLGLVVDRFGPRRVALVGVLATPAAIALLSTATGTMNNWVILWGIVALAVLGVQPTIWTSAVASRFAASRGLALSITLSGAPVSASVFPILSASLIQAYGWRTAFIGIGAIWAILLLPLIYLFFHGAQDARPNTCVDRQAAAATLPGLTVAEGLRQPAFYKLMLAGCLFAFCVIGIAVHLVPILIEKGAAPMHAAAIASLVGTVAIIARLSTGWLLDRLPGHLVGAVAFLFPIVACTLLLWNWAGPLSYVLAALSFGLTIGAELDVIAYLASRHFGLKSFGVLFGAVITALVLGTAFGPLAAAVAFDQSGSYSSFLTLTMIFMALSALALVTLGRAPELVLPGLDERR